MTYEKERACIIETCLTMCDLGYFIGTWGNVSMRVDDHILLTPSRVDYATMRPEDIVVIDLQGNKVEGDRNPTSEKEVHRQIYLKRSDVNAIIHAHTVLAMAVSATTLREVPCLVEEMSQLLGGSIPITEEYCPAQQHFELGKAAAAAIGERNAVLLRNHGPVACGSSMDNAILATKVVEKSCQIFLKTYHGPMSQHIIPDEYVESEHYRYRFSYGKEKT